MESYSGRISDLSVDIEVSDSLEYAILTSSIEVDSTTDGGIDLRMTDPSGKEIEKVHRDGAGDCKFIIKNPELWYPVGYGSQPLHTVQVSLSKNKQSVVNKVGLRHAELIQRPIHNQPGSSFFFRVNNIPIYCQGTNWITGDTFLPRMATDRYRKWLEVALQSNQNMIRV